MRDVRGDCLAGKEISFLPSIPVAAAEEHPQGTRLEMTMLCLVLAKQVF